MDLTFTDSLAVNIYFFHCYGCNVHRNVLGCDKTDKESVA